MPNGMQDAHEHIRIFHQLGIAVSYKAISDDQAKRDRRPARHIPPIC